MAESDAVSETLGYNVVLARMMVREHFVVVLYFGGVHSVYLNKKTIGSYS
jgi:hypothetical protein